MGSVQEDDGRDGIADTASKYFSRFVQYFSRVKLVACTALTLMVLGYLTECHTVEIVFEPAEPQ
jgi:hypothetical protein